MESTTKTQKLETARSRALSETFFEQLKNGVFKPLVERVRRDKDLDLEFRHDYINIYYRGHSILLLKQNGTIQIDKAFTEKGLTRLTNEILSVQDYLKVLPYIKDNVSCHSQIDKDGSVLSKQNRELEFEQLLIRANNHENRNNSEYIIIDRQYVVKNGNKTDRWDLIALRYPSDKKPARGYLSIIEVKYGSKLVLSEIKQQVERYGCYYENNKESICHDMESVFKQKLKLGLITRSKERLKWLEGLSLVEDVKSTEIMLYLIDCNPNKIRELEKAQKPDFLGEAHIASGGLALWQGYLKDFGGNVK